MIIPILYKNINLYKKINFGRDSIYHYAIFSCVKSVNSYEFIKNCFYCNGNFSSVAKGRQPTGKKLALEILACDCSGKSVGDIHMIHVETCYKIIGNDRQWSNVSSEYNRQVKGIIKLTSLEQIRHFPSKSLSRHSFQ